MSEYVTDNTTTTASQLPSEIRQLKSDRTRSWIESHAEDFFSDDDILSTTADSSVADSCDIGDDYSAINSDSEYEDGETVALGQPISTSGVSIIKEAMRDLMNSTNSVQTVGNVNISNSTNVHIGNVTNINGNIQIIAGGKQNRRKAKIKIGEQPIKEEEEYADDNAFIRRPKFVIPKELCSITPRHSWLAQKPMKEPACMDGPAKKVIILHTATESSEIRAINVRTIRDIQTFHIESRGWWDIAYNFLIGCDGIVYEGRGWGAVGSHTQGHNIDSLGIAFIGCFMRELPTEAALNMCKNLLKHAVEMEHLKPDYKLLCHCQCTSTESPGRRLFEEIQTWDHFYQLPESN